MPEYRQIHVSIWKDPWFFELNANEKFLFIYLFSNERSNLTGLYELHSKVIAFETDLNTRQIDDAFASFEKAGKVYREGTWIWIPNLIKYNTGSLTSPTVRTHIKSSLSKIPDIPLKARCIEYYNSMVDDEYRIDTLCIPYTEDAQEQEHEQEHEQENTNGAKIAPDGGDTKNKVREALEINFSTVTGLQRPKTSTQSQKKSAGSLWWNPLREIAELCEWDTARAIKLIDASVDKLKGGGLTIASPKSILNTALALVADGGAGGHLQLF